MKQENEHGENTGEQQQAVSSASRIRQPLLSELDSNFDSKAREKLMSLTIQSEHEMA